jgi:hypothetical protein
MELSSIPYTISRQFGVLQINPENILFTKAFAERVNVHTALCLPLYGLL